jgi:hypothetical protein
MFVDNEFDHSAIKSLQSTKTIPLLDGPMLSTLVSLEATIMVGQKKHRIAWFHSKESHQLLCVSCIMVGLANPQPNHSMALIVVIGAF